MPIEIKELHVKVTVNEIIGAKQPIQVNQLSAKMKNDLVRECVEKVMEKMNRKTLR